MDLQDFFKNGGPVAGQDGQVGPDGQSLLGGKNGNGETPTKNSPLVSLKRDLDFYQDSILEVAKDLLEAGYSDYPIFIAHQHQVNLGEVILDKNELGTNWTIQVSSLEEFIEKGVIKADRKAKFVQNFKDPQKFMCLFVMVPEGANFVFNPYGKNADNK